MNFVLENLRIVQSRERSQVDTGRILNMKDSCLHVVVLVDELTIDVANDGNSRWSVVVRLWTDNQRDQFTDWCLGLRASSYLGIIGTQIESSSKVKYRSMCIADSYRVKLQALKNLLESSGDLPVG